MESKNNVSVIIPYWETYPEKKNLLKRCVNSLKDVEIIVVWNDGMGYAPAINRGCMVANGDYFLIMNDDVYLKSGDLKDLCIENKVVSPSYDGRVYPYIWGSCFCVPRNIWEDIGGMDERYTKSYFDDDHLIMSLLARGTELASVPSVVFGHDAGSTMDKLSTRNDVFLANREKFVDCWGAEPSIMYHLYEKYGRVLAKDEVLSLS